MRRSRPAVSAEGVEPGLVGAVGGDAAAGDENAPNALEALL
jgi:hypothetical protein